MGSDDPQSDRKDDHERPARPSADDEKMPPARIQPARKKVGEPPGNLGRRSDWFRKRSEPDRNRQP